MEKEEGNPTWTNIKLYMEALGIGWADLARAAGELDAPAPAAAGPAATELKETGSPGAAQEVMGEPVRTALLYLLNDVRELKEQMMETRRHLERRELAAPDEEAKPVGSQ